MSHNPRKAKAFIALITAAGLCSISYSLTQTMTWHLLEAAVLLAITATASRMRMKLPGLTGNMSVNLPFLLLAVAELNPLEALAVACVSVAIQCIPKDGTKPKPEQMLFNVSSMAFAVVLGWRVFHQGGNSHMPWLSGALMPALAVAGFFLLQTLPVSVMISLTDAGPVQKVWTAIARMTFPYYVLSAGVTFMVMTARQHVGWQMPLLLLPVMYFTYVSYQTYFGRSAMEHAPMQMSKAARAGQ